MHVPGQAFFLSRHEFHHLEDEQWAGVSGKVSTVGGGGLWPEDTHESRHRDSLYSALAAYCPE